MSAAFFVSLFIVLFADMLVQRTVLHAILAEDGTAVRAIYSQILSAEMLPAVAAGKQRRADRAKKSGVFTLLIGHLHFPLFLCRQIHNDDGQPPGHRGLCHIPSSAYHGCRCHTPYRPTAQARILRGAILHKRRGNPPLHRYRQAQKTTHSTARNLRTKEPRDFVRKTGLPSR